MGPGQEIEGRQQRREAVQELRPPPGGGPQLLSSGNINQEVPNLIQEIQMNLKRL